LLVLAVQPTHSVHVAALVEVSGLVADLEEVAVALGAVTSLEDMVEVAVVLEAVMEVVEAAAPVPAASMEELRRPRHPTLSRILLPLEATRVPSSTFGTFHGPLATKIWSSYSQPSARSSALRSSTSRTGAPVELVSSNSRMMIAQRPLLVNRTAPLRSIYIADSPLAKFTGYQYGGRPLGLTYVKYSNLGGGDMMDTDATGGLTQDQIM